MVGDNAYPIGETLLAPFSGSDRNNTYNSNYNFYLSQLRIRIEMAFGQLVSKWGIFNKPLQTKLSKSAKVFLCAAKLHNYCINQGDKVPVGDAKAARELTQEFTPGDNTRLGCIIGFSGVRAALVVDLAKRGKQCPPHNLARNRHAYSN